MDGNWERFYQFTHDRPHWPLVERAAALLPEGGRALDLGAGAGRDTRYLLAHGFAVTAVDADAHAAERLHALGDERLRVVQSTSKRSPSSRGATTSSAPSLRCLSCPSRPSRRSSRGW